jgi:CRP/FNR family cyclic AMP-dependent transcriptional regulator
VSTPPAPATRTAASGIAHPGASDHPALARLFLEYGAVRAFGPGWLLARLGDTSATTYLIRSGKAKITAPTDRGVAVVGLRRPGQFVGIGAAVDGEPRISAATVGSSVLTAYTLSAEPLRYYLGRSREAAFEVSRLLAIQLRGETLRLLENQGLVVNRIARCLLYLATPSDDTVELTQAELAATIGASQVSVENELRSLRANNVITTSYGSIVIRDRNWLRAASGRPEQALTLRPPAVTGGSTRPPLPP